MYTGSPPTTIGMITIIRIYQDVDRIWHVYRRSYHIVGLKDQNMDELKHSEHQAFSTGLNYPRFLTIYRARSGPEGLNYIDPDILGLGDHWPSPDTIIKQT
jgi:hypothetical protein